LVWNRTLKKRMDKDENLKVIRGADVNNRLESILLVVVNSR